MADTPAPDYIGDGVYVSCDGYGINLSVNHHTNNVAYLEPEVLKALFQYAQRCGMKLS